MPLNLNTTTGLPGSPRSEISPLSLWGQVDVNMAPGANVIVHHNAAVNETWIIGSASYISWGLDLVSVTEANASIVVRGTIFPGILANQFVMAWPLFRNQLSLMVNMYIPMTQITVTIWYGNGADDIFVRGWVKMQAAI